MGRGSTENAVKVHTRVARLSYGWAYAPEFSSRIHDRRDRYWDDTDGICRARNQMKWPIKRGQDISEVKPKTYAYRRSFKASNNGIHDYRGNIYTSTEAYPSSRLNDTVTLHSVMEYKTPLPVEELTPETRNGMMIYAWYYKYKIHVSGASLSISVISDDAKDVEVTSKSLTMETG
ncbi:hypothetical protein F4801DRAFT_171577 [Xylaria longipes]|nr:hypothetical protein F4801DRAFT_171577 [Xylaria longipes]